MSHYFINDENLKDEKKIIKFNMFNKEFSFNTNSGVFSKNHLDYGTKLLLENIDVDNLNGKVLDLGCGIGIIGIIIKKTNKMVEVNMADINERAVNLAKDNNILNKVDNLVLLSNAYSNIDYKYDYIITNPPIRAGKNILREILKGSYNYLNSGGILFFVMRKDHGVKSMIRELDDIFDVSIVAKDKGFYIVKCIKNDKN